ncbi:hypothetical protein Tco_1184767 [Tanacetum coccineum]
MMTNLSEDIQSAGSDTRPPMLDRSDFESWQQRIRLYCLGKETGKNILQSIDEGPFKMGKFRDTLADSALGPERDRVVKDLTPEEKEMYKADIRATNILLQGSELTRDERESQLYDDFEHFHQKKREIIHEYYVRFTKFINDMRNIKMTMPKMQLNSKFVNNILPEWGRFMTPVKLNRGLKTSNYDQLYAYLKQHEAHANENKTMLEIYTQISIDPLAFVSNVSLQQVDKTEFQGTMQGEQLQLEMEEFRTELAMQTLNLDYFKDKMLMMQAQENGVVLDEEQLLFIAGGQDNTFDDDVDEPPTMFMENLSLADLIYDKAGALYDSDILSKVQDHDNYLDSVGKYHEVHEMQNDVQQNYVVDSNSEYTSDSNIIPYEQYVKNNAEHVVQSNVSSMPNDALMMIINDMHEHAAQCISANEQNKVVNESLTAELARYKEQVKIYEKRASAMQVQYALYNGHEIVKTNHAPVVVHDSEDTLELAEITRKRMIEKLKTPL